MQSSTDITKSLSSFPETKSSLEEKRVSERKKRVDEAMTEALGNGDQKSQSEKRQNFRDRLLVSEKIRSIVANGTEYSLSELLSIKDKNGVQIFRGKNLKTGEKIIIKRIEFDQVNFVPNINVQENSFAWEIISSPTRLQPDLSTKDAAQFRDNKIRFLHENCGLSYTNLSRGQCIRLETMTDSKIQHEVGYLIQAELEGGTLDEIEGIRNSPLHEILRQKENTNDNQFDFITFSLWLNFAQELLQKVKNLHDSHFLHMDIQEKNIICGKDGACHLIDFGLGVKLNAKNERDNKFIPFSVKTTKDGLAFATAEDLSWSKKNHYNTNYDIQCIVTLLMKPLNHLRDFYLISDLFCTIYNKFFMYFIEKNTFDSQLLFQLPLEQYQGLMQNFHNRDSNIPTTQDCLNVLADVKKELSKRTKIFLHELPPAIHPDVLFRPKTHDAVKNLQVFNPMDKVAVAPLLHDDVISEQALQEHLFTKRHIKLEQFVGFGLYAGIKIYQGRYLESNEKITIKVFDDSIASIIPSLRNNTLVWFTFNPPKKLDSSHPTVLKYNASKMFKNEYEASILTNNHRQDFCYQAKKDSKKFYCLVEDQIGGHALCDKQGLFNSPLHSIIQEKTANGDKVFEPSTLDLWLNFAISLFQNVQMLHDNSYFHMNINEKNVLYTQEGHYQLINFALGYSFKDKRSLSDIPITLLFDEDKKELIEDWKAREQARELILKHHYQSHCDIQNSIAMILKPLLQLDDFSKVSPMFRYIYVRFLRSFIDSEYLTTELSKIYKIFDPKFKLSPNSSSPTKAITNFKECLKILQEIKLDLSGQKVKKSEIPSYLSLSLTPSPGDAKLSAEITKSFEYFDTELETKVDDEAIRSKLLICILGETHDNPTPLMAGYALFKRLFNLGVNIGVGFELDPKEYNNISSKKLKSIKAAGDIHNLCQEHSLSSGAVKLLLQQASISWEEYQYNLGIYQIREFVNDLKAKKIPHSFIDTKRDPNHHKSSIMQLAASQPKRIAGMTDNLAKLVTELGSSGGVILVAGVGNSNAHPLAISVDNFFLEDFINKTHKYEELDVTVIPTVFHPDQFSRHIFSINNLHQQAVSRGTNRSFRQVPPAVIEMEYTKMSDNSFGCEALDKMMDPYILDVITYAGIKKPKLGSTIEKRKAVAAEIFESIPNHDPVKIYISHFDQIYAEKDKLPPPPPKRKEIVVLAKKVDSVLTVEQFGLYSINGKRIYVKEIVTGEVSGATLTQYYRFVKTNGYRYLYPHEIAENENVSIVTEYQRLGLMPWRLKHKPYYEEADTQNVPRSDSEDEKSKHAPGDEKRPQPRLETKRHSAS